MKIKMGLLTLALVLAGTAVLAEEYPATIFDSDGEMYTGTFIRQDGMTVYLRVEGQVYQVNTTDLGVVIFDNNFTNFYDDQNRMQYAEPHLMVLKRNAIVSGRVESFIPGGRVSVVVPQGSTPVFNAVDIARVYYNAPAFFANTVITGPNTAEMKDDGSEEEETKTRKDRKKNRNKNRQDNQEQVQQVERIGGGEIYIVFRNGSVTRGLMYDITGTQKVLVLRDGRRFNLTDIAFINYVEIASDYPDDRIYEGYANFIMRNGSLIYGHVADYKGGGNWELTDGRLVNWGNIARIYF